MSTSAPIALKPLICWSIGLVPILQPPGNATCAYIGIYLKDPASFDAVTRALEAIPEIVECHFTTGKYDMFIKLYARNNHHLLSIIHDKLQPLGLARTETLISFHEAIKRQMPITVEEEED